MQVNGHFFLRKARFYQKNAACLLCPAGCGRKFEVGRQSRVGALEITILLFFDICKSRGFFVAFLHHFSID